MEYALHYGSRRKPLALVKPDERWGGQGMFRIHWPDGEVSDMVNLSRAREAARLIARRRHPECNEPKQFKWLAGKATGNAPPMRETDDGLPE